MLVQASALIASPPSSESASALSERLFTLLRRLTLDPSGADHFRAIEEHDLTISQVRALLLLACTDPEPLPGGRIAERLGISPAAISRALDGLVRSGLLERGESDRDRRVRPFAITATGRAVAEELAALRRAQLDRFVATLDEGQRELLGAALAALDNNTPAAERTA